MAIRTVLIEFDTAQMGNDKYRSDQTGLWMKAFKRLQDEVPPILAELECEFQELLGVIEVTGRGDRQGNSGDSILN
jgi:hypothetical protein